MSNFSHAAIPAEHLTIALSNAALDPDGQTFPWLPGYPLIGSTVVHEGQLYTVSGCERSAVRDSDLQMVRLVGQGHDGMATAARYELRPVTWTDADEGWQGHE